MLDQPITIYTESEMCNYSWWHNLVLASKSFGNVAAQMWDGLDT